MSNALDPFDSNKNDEMMPGILPGINAPANILDNYKYRVGVYQLGGVAGGDGSPLDQLAELENLLTQSIRPERNVIIVSRKESISTATGVYTIVVTYLEKTINA